MACIGIERIQDYFHMFNLVPTKTQNRSCQKQILWIGFSTGNYADNKIMGAIIFLRPCWENKWWQNFNPVRLIPAVNRWGVSSNSNIQNLIKLFKLWAFFLKQILLVTINQLQRDFCVVKSRLQAWKSFSQASDQVQWFYIFLLKTEFKLGIY